MSFSPPQAFSTVIVYLRFSSDGQADGYSFERQRRAAEERLSRWKLPDGTPVEWLEDAGYSAFTGKHTRSGQLGKFVQRVQSGELKNGLFICERVSRASRQGSLALLSMLNVLLQNGFTIQFLEETESFDKDNMPDFLGTQLAIYADIAHMESKAKSDFAKANWDKRRRLAAQTGEAFTSECPNWLQVVDGKYVPIPERVTAIRTLYALARDGWGISKLVRYANENKLPVPGKGSTWHTSLVNRVLSNAALVGRFQPQRSVEGKRQPLGDAIENFFPVVLDVDLFDAVQNQRAKAVNFPKRRDDNNFNYLMGIAKCSCGGSWRRMNKNSGAQAGYALYSCSNRVRGTTKCPNISAKAFDFQFVSFACDGVPRLLHAGGNPARDRREEIQGALQGLAKRRAALLTFVENNPDLAAEAGENMRAILGERKELEAELAHLLTLEPPPEGFTFDQGVEVFLPAYLDFYGGESVEAKDAFRARALFATRIRDAVASVTVAEDRRSYAVQLKNGTLVEQELDPSLEFAPVEPCQEESEREVAVSELARERRLGLELVRLMGNCAAVA